MKQKIYIPQPIAAAGEDYLIEKGYEIVRGSGKTDKESIKNDIAVCDAMIQRTAKVDKEILEAGKNLKIIARHGAGYDNLDWKAANELGIYTTYSPDTTTLSVAEFTITVILNLAKCLKESEELVKEERDMPPEYAGLTERDRCSRKDTRDHRFWKDWKRGSKKGSAGAGYESHFLCATSRRKRNSRVYRNRILGRTFANIGLYQSACAGRRKEPGNYFKKRVCHDEEIRFPDSSFQRRCC